MNTHRTKVVEVELKRIGRVHDHPAPNTFIPETTDGTFYLNVVSSQDVLPGDYLNVTDKGVIYHIPKHIVEGEKAKYEKI